MIYDFEYGKQNGEQRERKIERERAKGGEAERVRTCIDGIEGRIKNR